MNFLNILNKPVWSIRVSMLQLLFEVKIELSDFSIAGYCENSLFLIETWTSSDAFEEELSLWTFLTVNGLHSHWQNSSSASIDKTNSNFEDICLFLDAHSSAKHLFQQASYPVPDIEITSHNGKYGFS